LRQGNYVDTTHSSQSQTADRVPIHADTELGAKDPLNNRMAYVAVSRGAHDAQIFTSDRAKLSAVLRDEISHGRAHCRSASQCSYRATARASARTHETRHY
jgi:hypothetical protein